MVRQFLLVLLLGLVTGGSAFNAQAQLYKWVDEEGNVHFSDQPPADENDSSVVPDPQPQSGSSTSRKLGAGQPLIRPYDKEVRKLHLPDVRYLWKSTSHARISTKVGVYHTGKACTTRGAIKAPEVFVSHASLLPSETRSRRVAGPKILSRGAVSPVG